MKTHFTSILSIFCVVTIAVAIQSCEGGKSENLSNTLFHAGLNQSFDLRDQRQLNEAARVLSGEQSELEIVENASVLDLVDSKGAYKAISLSYKTDGKYTHLLVPIAVNAESGYFQPDACQMKCSTTTTCAVPKHSIVERCGVQICSCGDASGSAQSSVAYRN